MSRSSESGYSSDEFESRSPSNHVIKKDQIRFDRNYEVSDLLTKSANGVIYNGFCLKTGNPVIIKQIPRDVISTYVQLGNRLCPSEIAFHFEAAEVSQTVVRPLDWFERRSSFVLVMEKFENAIDLFEFSRIYGAIPEEPAKLIFRQLAQCALDLDQSGIVHRDLKDENVLINPANLEVKIIDFGCATVKREIYKKMAGTPEYFPPEWYSHQQYSSDGLTVFSLGVILYILLTGTWEFEFGTHKRNFLAERNLSTVSKSFLDCILCPFPSKRISLSEILEHKFF